MARPRKVRFRQKKLIVRLASWWNGIATRSSNRFQRWNAFVGHGLSRSRQSSKPSRRRPSMFCPRNPPGIFYYHDLTPRNSSTTPKHQALQQKRRICDHPCHFSAILPQLPFKSAAPQVFEWFVPPKRINLAPHSVALRSHSVGQDTTSYGRKTLGLREWPRATPERLCASWNAGWWSRFSLRLSPPNRVNQRCSRTLGRPRPAGEYIDHALPKHGQPQRSVLAMNRRDRTADASPKLLVRCAPTIPALHCRTSSSSAFPGETKREFPGLYDFFSLLPKSTGLGVFRIFRLYNARKLPPWTAVTPKRSTTRRTA